MRGSVSHLANRPNGLHMLEMAKWRPLSNTFIQTQNLPRCDIFSAADRLLSVLHYFVGSFPSDCPLPIVCMSRSHLLYEGTANNLLFTPAGHCVIWVTSSASRPDLISRYLRIAAASYLAQASKSPKPGTQQLKAVGQRLKRGLLAQIPAYRGFLAPKVLRLSISLLFPSLLFSSSSSSQVPSHT